MADLTVALRQATETILRALVRILLRNGVPYGAFAELTKRAYVQVAEQDFALGDRKQTVSRIATLTGLTRKEVRRVQQHGTSVPQPDVERHHRPARVIGGWVRESRYHDKGGRPADLPMEGNARSFAALVREFSGDIPTRAMADELSRIGAIRVLADGRVRLLTRAYVPRGDQAEKLAILGSDVADLIRTIDHNLTSTPRDARFQRRVSYDNIPRELLPELKKQVAQKSQSCLEALDRVLVGADRDRNPSAKGAGRGRVGVGIYYFEETIE